MSKSPKKGSRSSRRPSKSKLECALCENLTDETSLKCSSCGTKECFNCLNRLLPNTVTKNLLLDVVGKKSLTWHCESCSSRLLPKQLMVKGHVTQADLDKLGVNPAALVYLTDETPELNARRIKAFEALEQIESDRAKPAANSKVPSKGKNTNTTSSGFTDEPSTSQKQQQVTTVQDQPPPDASAPDHRQQDRSDETVGSQTPATVMRSVSRSQNLFTVLDGGESNQSQPPTPVKGPSESRHFSEGCTQNQAQGYPNPQQYPFPPSQYPQVQYYDPLPAIPRPELRKFDGKDRQKWTGWWEHFNHNVHSRREISTKTKWDLLLSSLTEKALKKISYLPETSDSYEPAIAFLIQSYKREDLAKPELRQKLLSIRSVKADLSNLEDFTDEVRCVTSSLSRSGMSTQALHEYVPSLFAKLPDHLRVTITTKRLTQCFQSSLTSSEMTLEELLRALMMELELHRQTSSLVKKTQAISLESPKTSQPPPTMGHLLKGNKQPDPEQAQSTISRSKGFVPKCLFCEQLHFSSDCQNVPSHKERIRIATKKKVCFRCLRTLHRYADCPRVRKCWICSSDRHHVSLCDKKSSSKENQAKPNDERSKKSSRNGSKSESDDSDPPAGLAYHQSASSKSSSEESPCTVMGTMKATLINPETGAKREVNVYFDSGAEDTTLALATAEALNLTPLESMVRRTAVFGVPEPLNIPAKRVQFTLFGNKSKHSMQVKAWAMKTVCPKLHIKSLKLNRNQKEKLMKNGVVNKPPKKDRAIEIDLIIGMDYYNAILHPADSKVIFLTDSLRILPSAFGGILTGATSSGASSSKKKERQAYRGIMCQTNLDQETCASVENVGINTFSDLETLGIENLDEENSKIQPWVKKFFEETTTRKPDGRFEVRLPFHPNAKIDSNFAAARKRLELLVDSFNSSPQMKEFLVKYNRIFEDQLDQEILKDVTESKPTGPILHYLPHFAVLKESSNTTKIRPVVDPSSRTKDGPSLNDLLYTGSNYIEDIVGILMRFRLSPFILLADVEAAFHQISLNPMDQDACRVLWLRDINNPSLQNNIRTLQFTRVPFGLRCSPYLLMETINHLVETSEGPLREKLQHQIYMDNVCLLAKDPEEVQKLHQEAKALFRSAKMNLREFVSNDAPFNDQLPTEDRMKSDSETVKFLGSQWNTRSDEIALFPIPEPPKVFTKRAVLHTIAKVFDPCGLMLPVTIRGRLLFQECWRLKLGWDDQLPAEMIKEWKEILSDLMLLHTISLSRNILELSSKGIDLVCFSDGSPFAYAAAIYIIQDGAEPKLLVSKARVAPIKSKLTQPKLEMMGVLIGIRLLMFVSNQIKHVIRIRSVHLLSDSQIVLQQIESTKPQPAWVQRRLDEIRATKKSLEIQFNHVPGEENSADHATRGISLDLMKNGDWFKGPSWLASPQQEWPTEAPLHAEADAQLIELQAPLENQEPRASLAQIPSQEPKPPPFLIEIDRFSRIDKLISVTKRCIQFITKARKMKTSQLSAHVLWILHVQESAFHEVISQLKSGKRTNSLILNLDLFLDENGIVRCGGRFSNMDGDFDAKHPILLPKKNAFTDLIIQDAHEKVFHMKTKSTLSKVREKFWIISGHTAVSSFLRNCLTCRRNKGKPFKTPTMGSLPVERVTSAQPWTYTAMDYLGPLYIRTPGTKDFEKRWIAIFNCFTSRAVHLEVIKDCSMESAVNAIQRFISRRSTPKVMMTDNQTAFIKAAKCLKLIWAMKMEDQEDLVNFFSQHGIEWRTTPERAPFFNGLSERLVALVKSSLRSVLGRITIGEEELQTLVIRIEGVINARPLMTNSTEFGDMVVLTPSHFIAPGAHLSFPPIPNEDDKDYHPNQGREDELLRNYRKSSKKLEQFQRIWSSAYLQELRQIHRNWKTKSGEIDRIPQVDEVCLARDNAPRHQWPLVRITELLRGPDGEVRYVRVLLPSGRETRRSVRDLIPLEASLESSPPADESATQKSEQVKAADSPSSSATNPDETQPRNRQGPTTRSHTKKMTAAAMIAFIAMIMFPFASASVTQSSKYQICAIGPGGRVLQMPKEVKCTKPNSGEGHKSTKVQLYLPSSHWPNSTAFLCYKEKTVICTYKYFLGSNQITQPPSVTREIVEFHTCKQASKLRAYEGEPLLQDSLMRNLWSTQNKIVLEYWWLREVCLDATNFILEVGEVATHDGKTIISNMPNLEKCRISMGHCSLPDAILIWSWNQIKSFCPFERKGTYNAVLHGRDAVSIASLQAASPHSSERSVRE